MEQNNDMESVAPVDGCVFPIGPDDQTCGRPIVANGKPTARRRLYCDNPDHTRGKAFSVRRRYELAAARGQNSNQHEEVQAEHGVPEHPVTDGQVSFAALLARFEQTSTQLATILHRATEVVRTVTDPDAASYEVQQRQREAAFSWSRREAGRPSQS